MDLWDITESLDYIGISFNLSIEYEIDGIGYKTDEIYKIRERIEKLDKNNDLFKLKEFLRDIGKKIRFYKIKKWLLLRKIE